MSEVVGEAIKEFNLIENYGNLDLIPQNVKQELRFIRQKPILSFAAILLALSPWLIYFGISQASEFKYLALTELKQLAEPYHSNEILIQKNQAKAQKLSRSIAQVEGLVETKTNWIQFFADIQEVFSTPKMCG